MSSSGVVLALFEKHSMHQLIVRNTQMILPVLKQEHEGKLEFSVDRLFTTIEEFFSAIGLSSSGLPDGCLLISAHSDISSPDHDVKRKS